MKKHQGQKLAAATAAMFITEPAFALMHTGGTGVIAGLAAGAIAYLAADELHKAKGGDELEEEQVAPPSEKKPKASGKPSLGYRLLNGKSVREEQEPTSSTPDGLPRRSPTFAEMKHLIKPGRDILGFDGKKFVAGDSLKHSVNIGLIGLPGSGKTTCLTFHVGQAIIRGAIVRGWDLHGDVAADLGNTFHILEDADEIVEDCHWITSERDRRIALRKQAQAGDKQAIAEWKTTREIFYIVDEFNALMLRLQGSRDDRKLVTNTLQSLISEGRKFKMRVILTGQNLPASLFGDGASGTRDNLSTRYAFKVTPRQAQTLGIEPQAIESLLPQISGEDTPGYAILDGGPLVHAVLISIPWTTLDDIRALLEEYGVDEDGQDEGLDSELDEDEDEELPEGITEFDLEQIVEAHNAGWRLRDIADLVQMDLNTFRTACELAGILQAGQSARQRPSMGQVPDTDAGAEMPPLKLMPKPVGGRPKADYPDAVKVWNQIGEPIGRPRLQKELQDRGFECSDDLAKQLLARIKAALEKQAAEEAGGGVAVGGGDE